MPASVQFPFKDSSNTVQQGQTLPIDGNGNVPVAVPASENHIGEVGGNSMVVTASFNRPADTTAYSIGDLISNSTTAGSVSPLSLAVARKNGGTGAIVGLRLSKSGTSITNALFRVHLFRTSPTASNGDNGALLTNGVTAVAIGYFDVLLDQVHTDGSKGYTSISTKIFTTATGTNTIFGLIEARAAYTPVSGETFSLALEVLRD